MVGLEDLSQSGKQSLRWAGSQECHRRLYRVLCTEKHLELSRIVTWAVKRPQPKTRAEGKVVTRASGCGAGGRQV